MFALDSTATTAKTVAAMERFVSFLEYLVRLIRGITVSWALLRQLGMGARVVVILRECRVRLQRSCSTQQRTGSQVISLSPLIVRQALDPEQADIRIEDAHARFSNLAPALQVGDTFREAVSNAFSSPTTRTAPFLVLVKLLTALICLFQDAIDTVVAFVKQHELQKSECIQKAKLSGTRTASAKRETTRQLKHVKVNTRHWIVLRRGVTVACL